MDGDTNKKDMQMDEQTSPPTNPDRLLLLEEGRNEMFHQMVTARQSQHPRIVQANPSPTGMFAFGLTTVLAMMVAIGAIEENANHLVTAFAIFDGGFLQFLAGMWEMRRGNTFGATAFSAFGMFWITDSIYSILCASYNWEKSKEGLATWNALFGLFGALMIVPTLKLTRVHQFVFVVVSLAFILLAGGQYSDGVTKAGAVFGLLAAFGAMYIGWAELVNETWGRAIIPLWPMTTPATCESNRVGCNGTPCAVHHMRLECTEVDY